MSVKDYVNVIGTRAQLTLDGFTIDVTVEDVREVYGKIQAEVTPYANGYGEKWVAYDRLWFEKKKEAA